MKSDYSIRKTEAETSHQAIELNDQVFLDNYDVAANDLKPVNLKTLVSKPVVAEDVIQGSLGNCYFLSALATIIRNDKNFVNRILKVTNGKFEVTFHDANDLNKTYTYVLDPTIVMKENATNKHKHDAIYILEKAYSIHRLITEPTIYRDTLTPFRKALDDAKGNKELALEFLETEKNIELSRRIAEKSAKLNHFKNSSPAELQLHELEDILLFKMLEKSNFNIDEAKNILTEKEQEFINKSYKDTINYMAESLKTERKDYVSALTAGHGDVVYRALLGVPSKQLMITEPVSIEFLLQEFLPQLRSQPPTGCDPSVKNILIKMFKDAASLEANYFHEVLKITPRKEWQVLQHDINTLLTEAQKDKLNKHTSLIRFFSKLNWTDPLLTTKVISNLIQFIEKNITYKRGLGKYTEDQTELYNMIWNHLHQGNYLTLSTKRGESSKGLLDEHAYEIVNCYERNGLKFVLVRNPWDKHVRDYEYKKKSSKKEKYTVISAIAANTLADTSFFKKTGLTAIPRHASIESPALSLPSKAEGGYFELEISDLCKKGELIYIAELNPLKELSKKYESLFDTELKNERRS